MAKNLEITLLLDYYGEMLTDKQRELIGSYYNDDLSLAEIAQNEGITRQGVRDAIKRAEAQLTEMEQRLHFAERFREIHAAAELIRDNAERLLLSSDADVRRCADFICSQADSLLG
jgi:predicted DNA-binding protein YlxM (UPF0122 family)